MADIPIDIHPREIRSPCFADAGRGGLNALLPGKQSRVRSEHVYQFVIEAARSGLLGDPPAGTRSAVLCGAA